MCTIMGGKIKYRPELFENSKDVKTYLDGVSERIVSDAYTKGGDYTKILFFKGNTDNVNNGYFIDKELYFDQATKSINVEKEIYNYLAEAITNTANITFMVFSRLTPEMELETMNIGLQPYGTIDKNYIVAHGTIPLKEDLMCSKNMVDTEILKYQIDIKNSVELVELLNGKIAIIKYFPDTNRFETMNNGLGVYEYTDSKCLWFFSNINQTTKKVIYKVSDILPYEIGFDSKPELPVNKDKRRLVSLFSGGLDILTSTHIHILKTNPSSIDLLYFDWGTNAVKEEIKAGNNYLYHLNNVTKVRKNFEVLEVKDIFKSILKITGLNKTRIADPDAKGLGQEEAEEAISYVPVRNSMLINLAVAWAEQKYPNEIVDIVIGANLSEGMIYADNSTSFIDAKNLEIKYSGQKTSKFNLVAPFANVTKTEMLKVAKAITDNYKETSTDTSKDVPWDLAYSCYFPNEDGSACNECGSCLLRNASFKRAFGNEEKVISTKIGFFDDSSDNDFFKLNGVKELDIVSDNGPEIENIYIPNNLDLNDLNIGDIIIDSRFPSVDLEVISFNSVDKIVVVDYLKTADSKTQDYMKLYKANEVQFLTYKRAFGNEEKVISTKIGFFDDRKISLVSGGFEDGLRPTLFNEVATDNFFALLEKLNVGEMLIDLRKPEIILEVISFNKYENVLVVSPYNTRNEPFMYTDEDIKFLIYAPIKGIINESCKI